MNRITIPAILVATVMVAGMFAFMPVEQASTVHTTGTTTLAANSITAAVIQNAAIDAATFTAGAIDAAAVADNIAPKSIAGVQTLFSTDITGANAATCTSTQDFILYVIATGAAVDTLTINDGVTNYVHTFAANDLSETFVLAAPATTIWTLTGSAVAVDVTMTILTQQGAVSDCAP